MVKRYDIDTEAGDGGDCEVLPLIESSDGDYVEYDDYAALLASHQELLAASKGLMRAFNIYMCRGHLGWTSDHLVDDAKEAIAEAEKLGGE